MDIIGVKTKNGYYIKKAGIVSYGVSPLGNLLNCEGLGVVIEWTTESKD